MLPDIREKLRKPSNQVLVLIGTLVLFIITNTLLRDSPLSFLPLLFAALIVVEIFVFVGMEVKEGAQKHGWKHEVVDTIIALLVAVAIWYGFSFILNTSSPISGVVSCSMLPNLQRGDFVVVQGAPIKAQEISMTAEELDSLTSNKSVITFGNRSVSIDGSLFSYCVADKTSDLCQAFMNSPENVSEQKGAFTYKYETCGVSFSSGTYGTEPCLKSILFHGNEYFDNFSNDVIVYQPPKTDIFSQIGDIVHRAQFKIDADGKTYYLTRGDNNPVLDMQVYDYTSGLTNHPIPQEDVRGKVIGRIPLLGYFKLFISGYFQEDPQCKTQLTFTHLS